MVNFAWHGGEPTALGLDYFQKIVALQKKHRPEGKKIAKVLVARRQSEEEQG